MIGTTSISTIRLEIVGRISQFLSSSLVKVHHSFGRAQDRFLVMCVPERGVVLDLPFADLRDRPGLLMLPICEVLVKSPRAAHTSGAEETRTPDPLLAKEVLYQLSYGPERGSAAFGAKL